MHCLKRDTLLSELQSALSTEALKKVIEYAFTTDNMYREGLYDSNCALTMMRDTE